MVNHNIIVVGAGPAGLLAAGRAAELGAKVLILEKMPSEGRKLLITGKGRCNITNGAAIGDFVSHVYPNGRFLRFAFSKFNSKHILELLKNHGVNAILGPNGRYFPETDQARDVLRALLKWVVKVGVEIKTGERVEKIIIENNQIIGVQSNGKILGAHSVILATGGKSYPQTGSTGDGYELARHLGHCIVKPIPALVPLETKGGIAQRLQGLNFMDVSASLWINGKKFIEKRGEMIFTHFGLSGPIILSLSRFAVNPLHEGSKVEIALDLFPQLSENQLDEKLIADLNSHGKKKIGNLLQSWMPASMVIVFIDLLKIDESKEAHQVTSKERKALLQMLKFFRLDISHNRSFKDAIITAGGVSLDEIQSKTMESKLIGNLYFAGEMMDLDADTGGYNLQIAYSTGWLAGQSCAEKLTI
jgi:predicted Rossmann fold flavoprotein